MLMIFSNEDNTEFRIGWSDEEFNMCSNENLVNHFRLADEQGLTSIQEEFGATTEYWDFRRDKECTKEEYIRHFDNYDSDVSFIVPICTFKDFSSATRCLKELNIFL